MNADPVSTDENAVSEALPAQEQEGPLMAHPYRAPPTVLGRPKAEPEDDFARFVTFAVMWLSSALRLAMAVRHGEPFGFQPALALALTVVAPFLVARTWRRERRRA